MPVASLGHMTMDLEVLKCGNCEELKLGVHATALGLAALCGLYNAAAWLSRREQHLALNALMYAALIAVEQRHVAHHIAELRRFDASPPVGDGAVVTEMVAEIAA
jgi:thiamine transporter ThiT